MSRIKQMLDKLAEAEGLDSGTRITNKKGKLTSHPTIDGIDPVSIADIDTKDEFEKELKKKVKGEATVVQTKPAYNGGAHYGGSHSHTHEFKVGEKRTTTDDGHDHAVIYSGGRPIAIGPAPDDGHIHEL